MSRDEALAVIFRMLNIETEYTRRNVTQHLDRSLKNYRWFEENYSSAGWKRNRKRAEKTSTAARKLQALLSEIEDLDIWVNGGDVFGGVDQMNFLKGLSNLVKRHSHKGPAPRASGLRELAEVIANVYFQHTHKPPKIGRLSNGTRHGECWDFARAVLAYGKINATDSQLEKALRAVSAIPPVVTDDAIDDPIPFD